MGKGAESNRMTGPKKWDKIQTDTIQDKALNKTIIIILQLI